MHQKDAPGRSLGIAAKKSGLETGGKASEWEQRRAVKSTGAGMGSENKASKYARTGTDIGAGIGAGATAGIQELEGGK